MSATSKKQAKTKASDLIKFSCNNAKEQFKMALGTYVQFLITSGEYYRSREHLVDYLHDVENEIFDLIDFD